MNPVVFYKNLAEETRLKILLLTLNEQELCVCEYVNALEISQPKVSRHLAQLREFGLLSDRKEGKWVFYSLSKSLSDWEKQSIELCSLHNVDFIELSQQRLQSSGERPQRQVSCC